MKEKKMKKRTMIYNGKAKILYEGPDENTAIQYFKDDATAFNKEKHEIIEGKGVLNNFISAFIMERLNDAGIETTFIKRLNMREQLVRKVDIIPLEVVVRRKAAGSILKRYGNLVEDGQLFESPLVEFFYKKDELADPLITPEAILAFEICDHDELEEMVDVAIQVKNILYGLFSAIGIDLIDFKLEFGKIADPDFEEFFTIYLADEISPDNCRLRCIKTGASFDKDIFREGKGNLTDAYSEIARRLNLLPEMQTDKDNKIVRLHADLKNNMEQMQDVVDEEEDDENYSLPESHKKPHKKPTNKPKK